MKTKLEYKGRTYTFSNEDLKVGDKVFSISRGKINDQGKYIHREFQYSVHSTGFPDTAHTIKDLNYSDYKPYQIQTNFGYGPIESYFKVTHITAKMGTLDIAYLYLIKNDLVEWEECVMGINQEHAEEKVVTKYGEDIIFELVDEYDML